MVLTLRTNGADAPHRWCQALTRSLSMLMS